MSELFRSLVICILVILSIIINVSVVINASPSFPKMMSYGLAKVAKFHALTLQNSIEIFKIRTPKILTVIMLKLEQFVFTM